MAKTSLDNILGNRGGTSLYEGLNMGLEQFGASDDSRFRFVIAITDGNDDPAAPSGVYTEVLEKASELDVVIYTVGLGSDYNASLLSELALATGGTYYHIDNAEDLPEAFNRIAEGTVTPALDSDEDGIADNVEIEGFRDGFGRYYQTDPENWDTDGDGLSDGEEVGGILSCEAGEYYIVISDPTKADTDGDGISDPEEFYIGTLVWYTDTDNDDLDDGTEVQNWFDPLIADYDGDGRLDKQEFDEGTDPYFYDKNNWEKTTDFLNGLIAGDFIGDTDSLYTVGGQITSSFIPFVADIRDIIPNLWRSITQNPEKWVDVGLNGLGIGLDFFAGADVSIVGKAGTKVSRFIIKNADDIPTTLKLLDVLGDNLPKVITESITHTDEVTDAVKTLAKSETLNLTRKTAEKLDEFVDISKHFLKTSSDLPIKETLDVGSDTWKLKPLARGDVIDGLRNGLGHNFPVADRLADSTLISTKSLDIGAKSYQSPSKLDNALKKYATTLQDFEKNWFKDGNNFLDWGGKVVRESDYTKKALEIVLPDVKITPKIADTLKNFQNTADSKYGIEIWFIIGK